MLEPMNELDEVWSQKLSDALIQAQTAGRGDVADYLALRASNDALRQTSVKWLFDSLLEIAAFANRNGGSIALETENSHRFAFGNSTLVGALARLRQGVRCLTIEAGWTRTPADGFMRGGALAIGRLSHFGISKHDVELFLVLENDSPGWFASDKNGRRSLFDSRNLNEHFQVFLGTN
ncbi:MAG: hypothetical protein LH472_14955 [Pyrinomonadaceae bacterium]|nr:hypothetical protein [Pyrinomonadaceae bacterium]